MQLTYNSIKAGAVGVDMGRNIWQSENPVPMIRAVRAIIHQNYNVDQAYKLYKDLCNQSKQGNTKTKKPNQQKQQNKPNKSKKNKPQQNKPKQNNPKQNKPNKSKKNKPKQNKQNPNQKPKESKN